VGRNGGIGFDISACYCSGSHRSLSICGRPLKQAI